MEKRKFLNAKNIIIGIIALILIGVSVAGVAIYLNDKGEATAATEQGDVENLPTTGNNAENTNPAGEDENKEGENQKVPTVSGGHNNQGTGTPTTEEIIEGIEGTVVEQERKLYEDLKLSWTTISIPTKTANMGIYKPELEVEKTATAIIKEDNTELTIDDTNVPMVRPGDIVIYTIRVSNKGNYKATNVTITETLDVTFDGKEIKAGEPVVTIATLDYGKVATLKVAYEVTQADIDAVEVVNEVEKPKNIENKIYVTAGDIEEQDEDIIIPVNPDIEDITGTKTWDDNNNQDGKRPESITINLLANREKVQSKNITKEDNWKWTFTNLPKYAEDGAEIVYTIEEEEVANYITTVNGYDVTNKLGVTTISGTKTWNDNLNQDGIRPESITINLLADGTKVGSKQVTSADRWEYEFKDVPKYDRNGTEIDYTIEEEAVANYNPTISGYDITNTHTPETITVSGSKTWNDNSDQDGIRTDSITINLYADGQFKERKTVTNADGWAWSFTDLPKYANGTEIEYTITENAVTGYSTNINGYNVTNTHTPETMTVSGSKTWNDNGNQDGMRPESITINLLANGTEVDSKSVSANDSWSWSFGNLPVYEAGTEIDYTIEEEVVPGYTTNVNGYNVTNTLETIKVSVHKGWEVPYITTHPEVTVQLYKNDVAYGEQVTLNAGEQWKHEWIVPKYSFDQAGALIENVYRVQETGVVGTQQDLSQYITTYNNKDNNINDKAITNTAIGIVETISYTQGVDRYERPVDVVLVLDTSGSMTEANTAGNSRAKDMVTAVNETITTIMKHNSLSKVAVVTYSGDATTILPLGRYEALTSDTTDPQNPIGHYLTCDQGSWNSNSKKYSDVSISTNVKRLNPQNTVTVTGATYIQKGIAEGANILTSADNDPTYEENGTEVYHIPILLLLSDGEPTIYNKNYVELTGSTNGNGSTATNDTAYYTIKTAVAYKAKIAQKYNNEAHMYTIGYGVDSLLLRTVLDPSKENIEECKESYWYSYTRALYDELVEKNELDSEGKLKTGNYADGSYAGKMDSAELSTLLEHFIHSSVTSTTHRIFTKEEIEDGMVYLENIDETKSFSLHYGDKSFVTLGEAMADDVKVVKRDDGKLFVDLSVTGMTNTIHISYHTK